MTAPHLTPITKAIWALYNWAQGYNIQSNRDKFRLIEHTLTSIIPQARSFADLGGVWRVDAAYTQFTLSNFPMDRGFIIDTDFPPRVNRNLSRWKQLQLIQADFSPDSVVATVGTVDIVYLFDVLLHQANPHWFDVLRKHSEVCTCQVIYNQQWMGSDKSVRLTDLPLEEYLSIVPRGSEDSYRYSFAHRNDIHPVFQKQWIDIHQMWQWGITDAELRSVMNKLGFKKVYFADFGQFRNLRWFENHAFVFLKNQ